MDRDDRQDGADQNISNEPADANVETVNEEPENTTLPEQPSANTTPSTEIPAEEPTAAMDMEPSTGEPAQESGMPKHTDIQATPASNDKKRLLIMVGVSILLLVLVGALTFWLLSRNKETTSSQDDNTLSSSIEQPKLGIALTVADGTVEHSADGLDWQPLTESTKLEEGDFIHTTSGSRAVFTLDDGSAVRLDADTTANLKSLAANEVIIEQIAGTVYSRVVASDRKYAVAIEGATYEALGTAFITVKTANENGIKVFESSVKSSDSSETIIEGKQYFKKSSDSALQGKVTDLNIDTLVDDDFINWNLSQDESDQNFKDKLGVLSRIKQRGEEIRKERETLAEKNRLEAERILKERQEAERKANEQSGESMTLSLSGDTFNWVYTGEATDGYKLVYSKENNPPVFGKDSSIYFSNKDNTSGSLPKKYKIGGSGKYYVRVCAYMPNAEDDKCVDYSNIVVINL